MDAVDADADAGADASPHCGGIVYIYRDVIKRLTHYCTLYYHCTSIHFTALYYTSLLLPLLPRPVPRPGPSTTSLGRV